MAFITQPSFTAGELAPSLQARIDLAKYSVGAKTMLNMFCHAHGGVSNRPGSYMVTEVKDSDKVHRMIDFIYSKDQAYGLEFGDGTLRFVAVTNDVHGLLTLDLVEAATYKWVASGSGTNEYYMDLLAGGDPDIMEVFSVIEDATAMTAGTVGSLAVGEYDWADNDALGYNTVYVRLTDEADPDSKANGYLYTNIEIATPYASADLAELMYTQSADVMYLVHPDYYPRKLSRYSNTLWTMEVIDIGDGPYRATEPEDAGMMLTPASRGGSSVAITCNNDLFYAKHVGAPIRLGYINPLDATDIQWGYGVIDQVTNTKTARLDIENPFGYEQIFNPRFESGILGWEDFSAGTGAIAFVPADGTITLTMGTDIADTRQQLDLVSGEKVTLAITIDAIAATGILRVLVGTTSGASDISGPTSYTTIGTKAISFAPTQAEVYITLDCTGSVAADVIKISEVSLARADLSTPEFRIGAWNDTDGYPGAVGIAEQRLCFGGTLKYPLSQWLSQTGRFEDFSFNSPLEDSDSFTFRYDTGQVNGIQWIIALGTMIVGTTGVEWRVQAASTSESMGLASINAKPQSYHGSAKIPPLIIGSSAVFVQRGANAVRDLTYSLEVDGYAGDERSIMANHLFKDHTIEEWAYARLPDSIVWAVRDDGTLLGLTYMKGQDVWGWHRHETEGEYESVCSIPGVSHDWVYTIVKRTINGVDKRFIEVFMPRINDEATYDYFFVDCGLTYSGAAATSITGLDHLEGEDVAVLADGSVVPNMTVASGAITLPTAAELVHVGLAFTSDLGLLGINAPDNERGSSQGRTKTIPSVSIRFEKSRAGWAGPDEDHLDEIRFRDEAYGEDPNELVTEDKQITFNSGYDTDGTVFIRNVDPVPITVLSVTPDIEISER